MSVRDNQRSRVYKAERCLWGDAKPLREVKDIEAFMKKQLSRKAILKRYPDATRTIQVADGRGTRKALAYGDYKISIPLWARNEAVVIHEIAHIIAHRTYGQYRIAGHGWEFCSVFLDLVRFIMKREAHDALKKSFKEHRVKFTKPKKRKPLTPEQKAVLVERMKNAREARGKVKV